MHKIMTPKYTSGKFTNFCNCLLFVKANLFIHLILAQKYKIICLSHKLNVFLQNFLEI